MAFNEHSIIDRHGLYVSAVNVLPRGFVLIACHVCSFAFAVFDGDAKGDGRGLSPPGHMPYTDFWSGPGIDRAAPPARLSVVILRKPPGA